mmetsp:Transcript_20142/g.30022  ORF Transcript_20142/g.30022 Transcript_20142/m.30022 type:complete len:211 (-) Transcript_20142:483-1115(-)
MLPLPMRNQKYSSMTISSLSSTDYIGQELYNEHAKEHVDKHVFPLYEEHVAPFCDIAVAKGKVALAVAEPELKRFLLMAKEFCISARLSAISLTEDICRSSLSFLTDLKATDNWPTAPEWIAQGLTYIESEVVFMVDFMAYIFGVFMLFRYRIMVLKILLFLPLLPYRIIFGRVKSKRKNKKKKKVVVKQEKQAFPYGRKNIKHDNWRMF